MADPVTSNTATVVVQAVDKDKISNNIILLIILYCNMVLNTVNHLTLDHITLRDAQLFQHLHSGECCHGSLDDAVVFPVFYSKIKRFHYAMLLIHCVSKPGTCNPASNRAFFMATMRPCSVRPSRGAYL